MNFGKKIKIIIFTAFVVLGILYGAFLSIGRICSKYLTSEDIENIINKESELKFDFDNFRLYSKKDFCFEIFFKNLVIIAPDTKKELIKLENSSIKVSALPLIFKRVNLKKISSKSIYADLLMDEEGHFEIEKYLKKAPDFKVNLANTNINIEKYAIKFDDKMYSMTHKIEGKNIISNKISNKNINLKTEADLYSDNNKSHIALDLSTKLPILSHIDDSDFILNLKADNINLKSLHPYFAKYGIKDHRGIINLDVSTIRENNRNKISVSSKIDNLYLANDKSTIKNDNIITINTHAWFDGKYVNYDDFQITSNGIDIKSDGEIKNYLSKNPELNVNVELKDTELNNIIALIPDEIENPDISVKYLKKYNSHGLINGSLNILGNAKQPDVTGKMDFKNVYVIKLDNRIPFAYGTAELLKTFARVDVMAFARPNEWVSIKGDFDLYGEKKGVFNIKSSEAVNLEVARPILYAVRDVLDFVLGPLPMMDIKGTGAIDIAVEGTKEYAIIDGWFKFKNTEATIQGMNTWLKNASGVLSFKKEIMTFDDWHADIMGNPLVVNGDATTKGDVNINFILNNARFNDLVSVASRADYVKDFRQYLPSNNTGYADFKVNLEGHNLDRNFDADTIMKELKPSGFLKFHNCGFTYLKNVLVKNLNGTVEYGDDINLDLMGLLHNSKFETKGKLKNKNNKNFDVNLNLSSNGIHSSDIFKLLQGYDINNDINKNLRFTLGGNVNVKGEVPMDISKLNLEKFNLEGEIKSINDNNDNLKIYGGNIVLKGKDAILKNLNIDFLNSKIKADGSIKVLAKKPNPNLKIYLYDFKFYTLIETLKSLGYPNIDKLLADFTGPKGILRGNFEIHGENFKGKIEPSNLSIYSISKKIPYVLKSGDIEFNNKNLKLKAFNFDLGDVPFFIDAVILNFASKNPLFNGKFSTIMDEKGVDKFINSMLIYPIKVQGEVSAKGKISGYTNKYNINTTLTLNPNSDITYMGANIGDTENKREISINTSFEGNSAKIHKVELSKFISSQNNKTYPLSMIRMSGNINKKGDAFTFDPIVVKTSNPVNAKFFNMYFKKSILKQGLFNCDIKLTGDIESPKITGNLDLKDINIPLYDLKILNADVNINNENLTATLDGRSSDSDVKIKLFAKNKSTPPFVVHNLEIDSRVINLIPVINEITETIQNKGLELNTGSKVTINQDALVIEKGSIKAKEIKLNNTSAENFSSSFSHGANGILKIDNMTFDIAGGQVVSNGEIGLNNFSAKINSEIKNCDSNVLASEFLGMQNQIYGTMNGKVTFSGSKLHLKEGINTIKSKVQFEILEGRMPKLGSLEYLLKAANFYKSGLLGISLNNIIELVIPYQTGDFESIKGGLNIEDGIVKNIEVYSKGKNLSIFLEGSYDINAEYADILVFGRLAKNVSNMLGFVGNTSFNSLINMFSSKKFKVLENDALQVINKIPLIEISSDDFRIFTARIIGDINKDNYVKSFNWLN